MSASAESTSGSRIERWRLRVSGRVQGVYFRASTQEVGEALGLSGWVRNLPDGRVEALAEGPLEALEALATFCRRGPSLARVDDVQLEKHPAQGGLGPGFHITR